MKLPPRKHFLILFLFISLASLLVFRVNAHAGRTDDDGGHTDYETGEYHYHHGYSAHAHYDMDGDGIIDCPYDFDDQTSHQIGTSGGSGYSVFGNGDPYTSGYSDGYKKGFSDGKEDGYLSGYEEAERTAQKQSGKDIANTKTNTFWSTLLPTTIFFLVILLLMHKKHSSTLTAIKQDLSKKVSDYQKQIQNLKKTHSLEIEILKDQHSKEHSRINSINAIRESQLQREIAQRKTLQDAVDMWINRYQDETNKRILLQESYNPSNSLLNLPDDVTLEPFFTPIKGHPTKEYPYGEYTVFLTNSGKKYHADPYCTPGAKPYHYFDYFSSTQPCTKCVPLGKYPQTLPEWTKQLNKYSDKLPTDCTHKAHYLMESSDGMLVRVPEDKLDAWQAAQESHGPVPSPEMKKLFREEITKRIYGTPSDKE